jgi:hypothetical protein
VLLSAECHYKTKQSGILLHIVMLNVILPMEQRTLKNGTVHFNKCKQLFDYKHLLLLKDI